MLVIFNDFMETVKGINEFFMEDNGKRIYTVADITCFTQTWSSTALGFGGLGGQALTPAVTTIVTVRLPNGGYRSYVFFDKHFAYYVNEQNEAFKEDINKKFMADVDDALTKYNAVNKL